MMTHPDNLPHYDREQTYEWNFKNAPADVPRFEIPDFPGDWTYCGLPVNSPLGIAAGPLLNGKWIDYYAALGFDMLTYKTVRTIERNCYDLPNLVPVHVEEMTGSEETVQAVDDLNGSWAVSFGMPSKEPRFWIDDAKRTKAELKDGQLLSVSVVGTMQPEWSLEDLAEDYGECASSAFDANADCVEMNFSCPNVCSNDGQLFQNPQDAAFVAEAVRNRCGTKPLLVKIGYLRDDAALEDLLVRLANSVNAIVTTNSIPSQVMNSKGRILFDGQQRGICGRATRDASIDQVLRCREIIGQQKLSLEVIGVGGIETASDVQRYLDTGANSVQLATAVMIDPLVGVKIREQIGQRML